MSDEIKDDNRRQVLAVGNSWIVCKSKSHAGHVYYFNTLTGEAAWNLSDTEIEKAKSRTKHLEHLPRCHLSKCPEPKDKPPTNDSEKSLGALSESCIINTVTEQQSSIMSFSNIGSSNNMLFSSLNQIPGVMQNTNITNPPIVGPPVCNLNLNSLNNSVSTFNLSTPPIIYTPKVWAVPHTQHVFMAPTLTPVMNQNPSTLIFSDNNLKQTGSHTTSLQTNLNCFNNEKESPVITRGTRPFFRRNLNHAQGGQQNLNKNLMFTSNNDLRHKISAKKRNVSPSSLVSGGSGIRNNLRRTDSSDLSATIVSQDAVPTSELSDKTLENGCLNTELYESSLKIDLGPLKCLAPSDSNSDDWFIVVDLSVLLNEFKYLTSLIDSDDQCHIMVPKRVMDEFKTYVTCTEDMRARLILRLLSQQIETGYAFMADEPPGVELESMADAVYATCRELTENKYHIILLSNDNELLTYKNSYNIKIFSVDEVKKLLIHNVNKHTVSTVPKKTLTLDGLIRKIKITVPNDVLQNKDTANHKNDSSILLDKPEKNNTQEKMCEFSVLKYKDAGIQTDLEDMNSINNMSNVADEQELSTDLSNLQNSKEIILRCPVTSVTNVSDKKREIRLKRSTSNQTPMPSVELTKKRFKWRRRRNTTPQVIKAAPFPNNQSTCLKNVESLKANTLNKPIHGQSENMSNGSVTSRQNENKTLDDSIGSRESSIIVDQKNSAINVTIEETSTSGVISNTDSNVDGESNYSNCIINQQQIVHDKQSNMYEIENITMEEYLKIKSDEWVSRFIQIMEEVLSQVLQQDPPFTHHSMPPPWTLHEAAQCIAIKFSSHQDITDAANKLSNILFYVSDAKGTITKNMTPYQYMQMYSYGVHLLAAIMKVKNNCEDIHIAVDALKKLLYDIKNPNMDSSANDTFNDNIQDNSLNNEVTVSPDNQILDNRDRNETCENDTSFDNNNMEKSPNCKKRKLNAEEVPKPVQFIRNINIDRENLFFKSLRLQKINEVNNSIFKNNADKTAVQLRDKQIDTRIKEINKSQYVSENSEKRKDLVLTDQPRIIRSFTICPELENKLKRNCLSNVYEDHDNDLDYDEEYGEYLPEDYCSDNDKYNEQCDGTNANKDDDMKTVTTLNSDLKSPQTVSISTDDNTKKFKYMMYSLLQEIRNALCQVRILCDQCYEELKHSEGSTAQKCQFRKMSERAHLHIIRLRRSLQSMLDYDTNDPANSMRKLLKQADINICNVDDGLLFEYRNAVAKCKTYADVLLNSILNIISAFKS